MNMMRYDELIEVLGNDDFNYIKYSMEFEKQVCEIACSVRNLEDPQVTIKKILVACVELYEAEWSGIIEVDVSKDKWISKWWYSQEAKALLEPQRCHFYTVAPPTEWFNILLNDRIATSFGFDIMEDIVQNRNKILQTMKIDSYLICPFQRNILGFIMIINPKRHDSYIEFLQLMSDILYTAINKYDSLESSNKNVRSKEDININIFRTVEIIVSQTIINEEELNSPSIIRLLAYLLIHKNKVHSARSICDAIWPDAIINDPGRKIRSLAYRMNCILRDFIPDRLIISNNYGYYLNPKLHIGSDIDEFERLWLSLQSMLSTEEKKNSLKKIVDLYRGPILSSASGEYWIQPSEIDFHTKYLGSTNELLKIFFESKDYIDTQRYATQALSLDNTNEKAYFWLIMAMDRMGSKEMARGELRTAKNILIEEEYNDLLFDLKSYDFKKTAV